MLKHIDTLYLERYRAEQLVKINKKLAHAKASLLPRKVDPALRRRKIVSHYPIYAICFQYTVFKEHRRHNLYT